VFEIEIEFKEGKKKGRGKKEGEQGGNRETEFHAGEPASNSQVMTEGTLV